MRKKGIQLLAVFLACIVSISVGAVLADGGTGEDPDFPGYSMIGESGCACSLIVWLPDYITEDGTCEDSNGSLADPSDTLAWYDMCDPMEEPIFCPIGEDPFLCEGKVYIEYTVTKADGTEYSESDEHALSPNDFDHPW